MPSPRTETTQHDDVQRTMTLRRPLPSFGRRRASSKPAEPQVEASRGRKTSLADSGMVAPNSGKIAAGEQGRVTVITVIKKSKAEMIGLKLSPVAGEHASRKGEAVVVSQVVADAPAGLSKRLFAGDLLCAVNGVAIEGIKHACELLRESEGAVKLVIAAGSKLPEGWTSHVDSEGVVYYTHDALRLKTYEHPAAINVEQHVQPDERPPKASRMDARSRWLAAVRVVAVINSIADNDDHDAAETSASRERAATASNALTWSRV